MLRSERGIRRPAVLLALLWTGFLLLLSARGIPLRREKEAERLLKTADAAAYGTLSGRIRELGQTAAGSWSIVLSGASFQPDGGAEAWEAGTVLVYFPQKEALKPGWTLLLRGQPELFRPADNPGEFDARGYYLAQDIACFMDADAMLVTERRASPLRAAAFSLRSFLKEGLERVCPPQEAGLLSAMLLGERSGLSEEIRELYDTAGLSHLLSVSGLHVGFWALISGRLFGFLLAFFPFSRGRGRLSRFGYPALKAVLAGSAVLFYMLLSGGRVPVRRAGLMALLYQLALALRLNFDLLSAAALAALAVLIPYPYALFQSSFQLSFACVLLLGFLLPALTEKLHCETPLSRSLLLPPLVQMGTLPFSLWHFFCFHPYSAPANLLAVPFAGVILAGALLSALLAGLFLPAGQIAAGGVCLLLEGIRQLCLLIRRLPLHTMILGRPSCLQILIYLCLASAGFLLAFHIRRKEVEKLLLSLKESRKMPLRRALRDARRTALLMGLWLFGAAAVFLIRPRGELRLTSLYVGQGDCHVIELPDGSCYLVDAGSGNPEAGTRSILPFLRCRGIRRLDAVLVSHCDSDHMNAVEALFEEPSLTVRSLILPSAWRLSPKTQALSESARAREISLFFTGSGAFWEDGEALFRVLFPPDLPLEEPDNDASLTLLLSCRGFDALYTGDLGSAGESALLQKYAPLLKELDWLKVGHHGSRYSSAAPFLAQTSPAYALISCGRNNFYGHPAPETLTRLAAAGAQVLRTDRDGAVTLVQAADGSVRVQVYHQEETDMNKNDDEKISRSVLAACGIMIGIGLLAVCLALWGPGKGDPSALPGPGQTEAPLSVPGSGSPSEVLPPPESVFYPSRTEAAESWPVSAPAGEAGTFPPLPSAGSPNAGESGAGEDPQAAGFFFSPELTACLYGLFASELTNNTDEGDPFRSIPPETKAQADEAAERFVRGALRAEEAEAVLRTLSFVWPNDPFRLRHDVGEAAANVYAFSGRDMELAKERILLSNRKGRHYLFLRVYYNEAAEAVRIYMLNALIY